jgi:hypothetical protein
VFTGDPVEGDGAKERLKFAVSGIAYLALAVFALTVTVDEWGRGGSAGGGASGGSGGAGSGEQEATGTVLQWPAGRWIVAAVGLAVIAVAVYVIKHHVVDRSFVDRLRVGDGHWSVRLGQLGYGARSVAYGIIGVFLVQAAAAYDPEEAKGLSGTLQELSGRGWGQAVLWFVALGLLAYGLYCFAESYYRRSA